VTNLSSVKIVKLDDLKLHSLNEAIYSSNHEDQIHLLVQNIKTNGLINRIIVNKNNEVLCGNLRVKALKMLNVEEIEVYVKDIDETNELDFIISSNVTREKSNQEVANEIHFLFEKYSPGQGNKETDGENTIKLISSITGYTAYKITSIRNVTKVDKKLIIEVDNGKLSLHAAVKKCDTIKQKETDKTYQEWYSKTYPEAIMELNPPEVKKEEIKCPCCGQEVKKKNENLYFIKVFQTKLSSFIESIKKPAEAA
jgi:hypothetical protein